MSMKIKYNSLVWAMLLFLMTWSSLCFSQSNLPPYQKTVKQEFYDAIAQTDSIFFNGYNTCNLVLVDSMISEDLEFYHDVTGLSTSKKDVMQALKNNICGKVTRTLLPGSIEVYEVPGYGAVEMGFHGFRNNQEKDPGEMHYSKFVHIWRWENGKWKLTRVISLH